MAELYEDQEDLIPNGTCYRFYSNGVLESAGKYVHGKKSGTWIYYYPDRTVKDSPNYEDGHPIGISLGWYNNGTERNSLNVNENGSGVYV
jgi:antitoxin component YwqK of YwqJK toxin-antitoxin module